MGGGKDEAEQHFPSFSEGLSLRRTRWGLGIMGVAAFPFLFGGTFIEAATIHHGRRQNNGDFPSFSEGLSLRRIPLWLGRAGMRCISLPFRRDFH